MTELKRRALELFHSGLTRREVAAQLRAEGFRTKNNDTITENTVKTIVKNVKEKLKYEQYTNRVQSWIE